MATLASHSKRKIFEIRTGLIALARNPSGESGGHLRAGLAELGQALRDDPVLQVQINRFARRTAVGLATRYGTQIVRLVSETVKRWDATTVTNRLEGAVGRDLQFIRINGTLVHITAMFGFYLSSLVIQDLIRRYGLPKTAVSPPLAVTEP